MITIRADPEDVLAFVQVVDLGSFSKAAQALGVPKSSISRRIAKLEDRLGSKLLQRTTRKSSLTDVGRLYYERCRRALDELQSAEQLVDGMRDEPRGTLKLTVPVSLGGVFADIVGTFVERHPEVRVVTHVTNARVDLVAEGFDIAVRAGGLDDSSLIAKKLTETTLILAASPAYLEQNGRPRSLCDLADHECLLFGLRGPEATWQLTGPKGLEQVKVTGRFAANELDFIRHLAVQGRGICGLPRTSLDFDLRRGTLERVLPEYSAGTGQVSVVYPSAVHLSAKVRAFVELCTEKARELI